MDAMRARLAPLVGPELDPLWSEYRRRHPDADLGSFLARLRRSGRLTDDQVTRLLLAEEVTITLSGRGNADPTDGTRWGELGKLGAGAMGEVWLATDPALRRQVAVKRLRKELQHQHDLVRRFRAEAQITAQLDHPGILTIYGLSVDDQGQVEYAMRLIRGRTLDDVLQQARVGHKQGSLTEELELEGRLEVFLHVCDAMAYAHQRGVLHRDLKPENIMVGSFREVTVMDWGIAKLVHAIDEPVDIELSGSKAAQTQLGTAIGTPSYMSPEQARGENTALGPPSDQYALGLILQEIVTLRRANTGQSVPEILLRAQRGQRDPMKAWSRLEPLPRPLKAIVDKACDPDPARRYADVDALAADVRHFLRDDPIEAAPDGPFEKLQRWVGRHRTFMINAVLGLALLLVVGFTLLVAGATLILEINRQIAEAREAAAHRVLGRVAVQGQEIDGTLLRFEGLLHGAAYAAQQALAEPAASRPFFTDEQFQGGDGPPDLAHSVHYGAEVSMDWPIVKFAPGVDREAVTPGVHRIVRSHGQLWQVLVESGGPELVASAPATQRSHVSTEGAPIVWVIAATEDGVMIGVPGKGGYPDGYDPRERPWYTGAMATDGVFWDEPYVDASGMGLMVSTSMALRDPSGRKIGVASLDLDIDRLAATLVGPSDLTVPGAEAFLVDSKGTIKLRSGLSSGDVASAGSQQLPAEIWRAVQEQHAATGLVEVDGELVAWMHMASTRWIYLVRGPEEELLRSAGGYTGW